MGWLKEDIRYYKISVKLRFASPANATPQIISHDTESTCACGQRGCVEIYASARQMTRRYHSLQLEQQAEGADCASADPHVSCEEIFNQVERGHATADRVLEEVWRCRTPYDIRSPCRAYYIYSYAFTLPKLHRLLITPPPAPSE